MRRASLVLSLSVASSLAFSSVVAATSPGGWNHLGNGGSSSIPALNGKVYALNADNPGVLYVGGTFSNAGGVANADRIAKWDGSSWSALGSPVLTTNLSWDVGAIAYHAGNVYVGGTFQNAGGNGNADFLANWTGTSWQTACKRQPIDGDGLRPPDRRQHPVCGGFVRERCRPGHRRLPARMRPHNRRAE